MFRLMMKKGYLHPHMPNMHDMAVRIEHLAHNERFWAIMGFAVLFAVLIGLIIWAGAGAGASPETMPIRPYFPHSF